jgi:cobalamin biosynthesis protein CobD/CbiB
VIQGARPQHLRGAAWLILLLAGTGAALTVRSLAASHPPWLAIVAGAVLVTSTCSRTGGAASRRLRKKGPGGRRALSSAAMAHRTGELA